MVELPTQLLTDQLNRVCDTKVEGLVPTTLSMQRETLLQLNQTFPVTTSHNPVPTMPHHELVTTSSQLPGNLRVQPLSQSYAGPTEYVPRRATHQFMGTSDDAVPSPTDQSTSD